MPDARAAAATGRLLVLIRDWLRKQGHRTAWAWARENSDRAGSHVHVAIHIPPGVRWSFARLRRWIERVTGRPYLAGTVKTTRIGGTVNAATSLPDLYAANLARVVSYLTKASRDDGGPVIGKRCGFSQNLGRAAASKGPV